MKKIILCLDGSIYANSVCDLGVWASMKIDLEVSLLHIATPHFDVTSNIDLSGSIGLGAKSGLLEELAKIDEKHGRLEQKKGQLILKHASEEFDAKDIKAEKIHRWGSLIEVILELEKKAEMIIIGKNGEYENNIDGRLGSNLENIARVVHKPLLIATKNLKPIRHFLIAYDGSVNAKKALEYVITSSLFKGFECHLLKVCSTIEQYDKNLKEEEEKLRGAGFKVFVAVKQNKVVENEVLQYIKKYDINLLVIGAYRHSKIHSFILGSTTTSLIIKTDIPVLLFR